MVYLPLALGRVSAEPLRCGLSLCQYTALQGDGLGRTNLPVKQKCACRLILCVFLTKTEKETRGYAIAKGRNFRGRRAEYISSCLGRDLLHLFLLIATRAVLE